MTNSSAVPYWRLSGFYFFYFALVGTLMPFLGLYLQSIDFTPQQIGVIGAVLMATKIVAPNIWGWLSDRTARRLSVIRWGCFLALLGFLLLFWRSSFVWVLLAVFFYSFFWNAVLAQFEVVTLEHLLHRPQDYSRVRLWGSVGFIVAVLGLGGLFDLVSITYLPWFAALLLLLIWLSSLSVTERVARVTQGGDGRFLVLLLRRPVLYFLLSSFLLQLSHGTYYTFYSVYLESLGYRHSVIGGLWALGVLAEVGVFLIMHRWFQRVGLRSILLLTLGMTVLRWWLIACFPDSLLLLVFAQLLHAFSFGSAHSVAIECMRRFFPGNSQGQGQALYSSMSFGAGGALGAYVSGLVWLTDYGVSMFECAGLSALLGMLIVVFFVSDKESKSAGLQK